MATSHNRQNDGHSQQHHRDTAAIELPLGTTDGNGWICLGLDLGEIESLKQQGFVSRSTSASGTAIYKLRFRVNGRQRVKYLGSDGEGVERIMEALQHLQQSRHARRKRRQAVQSAACLLRQAKQQLEPLVEQVGWHFHGRTIRRPRAVPANLPQEILLKAADKHPVPSEIPVGAA